MSATDLNSVSSSFSAQCQRSHKPPPSVTEPYGPLYLVYLFSFTLVFTLFLLFFFDTPSTAADILLPHRKMKMCVLI